MDRSQIALPIRQPHHTHQHYSARHGQRRSTERRLSVHSAFRWRANPETPDPAFAPRRTRSPASGHPPTIAYNKLLRVTAKESTAVRNQGTRGADVLAARARQSLLGSAHTHNRRHARATNVRVLARTRDSGLRPRAGSQPPQLCVQGPSSKGQPWSLRSGH